MTRANWTPPFKAHGSIVKDAMGFIVARGEQESESDATDAAFRAEVIADALTAQVTPKALLIIIERLARQLMALETERDALLAAHKPTDAALIGVAPWQPPPEAERPHEYRCLGLVFGSWCDVVWYDGEWCFGQTLDPCDITAFAPLPPAPKATP